MTIDNIDDSTFLSLALEQEDDFSLCFKNKSVQCQVKSVTYNMRDLRSYLIAMKSITTPKYLICSAFSDEVYSLIEKREWFERRVERLKYDYWMDKESIVNNYKAEIEKHGIDYDVFQTTTLLSIPLNYIETIVNNSIITWAQKNNCSINTKKLLEELYLLISNLSIKRGICKKADILQTIYHCKESPKDIYVYLGLLESSDLDSREFTPRDRWIYYAESRTEDGLLIYPSTAYWDAILQQKKPMKPISYIWEPFAWEFPNIDLKILNRTNSTFFLTEIIFTVANSSPDPSPMLY